MITLHGSPPGRPRRNAALRGCAAVCASFLLLCCEIGPSQDVVPYSSRVIDFYPYDSNGLPAPAPAITLVYGATGLLVGRFEMEYDEANGGLKRAACYQYDENGANPALIGYDTYVYDLSGRIESGHTWVPDGESELEIARYQVTYWTATDTHYRDIVDSTWDEAAGSWRATNRQSASWLDLDGQPGLDYDAYGSPINYRAEQYFTYDESGTDATISSEYAAYYNSAGTLINELYHVIRGPSEGEGILPDGTDEGCFYVQYADNLQGYTCLQSDNWYDDPASPGYEADPWAAGLRNAATLAFFDDPFTYAINPLFIGNNADMVMYEYDANGNPTRDSFYVYGHLEETKIYGWLDASRISDRSRYVNGGASLEQRDCYRYYDADIGGTEYAAVETTTYYMNLKPDDGEEAFSRSKAFVSRHRAAGDESGFNPTASTDAGTLYAYQEKIRSSMRNSHERN